MKPTVLLRAVCFALAFAAAIAQVSSSFAGEIVHRAWLVILQRWILVCSVSQRVKILRLSVKKWAEGNRGLILQRLAAIIQNQ